jgi:predicted enzyme related to lactoylglutathione lyase
VALEAPDPQALAMFYAETLGWVVSKSHPEWSTIAAPSGSGCLAFQRSATFVAPVWPPEPGRPQMTMHIDVGVGDLQAAVAHAVERGAHVAAFQPQDDVRVMIDPAGHPFCLYLDPDST